MLNMMKIRGYTLFFKTENAELHWQQFPVEGQKGNMVLKVDIIKMAKKYEVEWAP